MEYKMKNVTFLTEEQLEDYIYFNRDKVHERGFPKFYKNTIRQFRLPNKKIIDLFTFEVDESTNTFYFRVIELKKDFAGIEAISQVLLYMSIVRLYTYNLYANVIGDYVLIGQTLPYISLVATQYLQPHFSLFSYIFDFDGVKFITQPYAPKEIHKDADVFLLKLEKIPNDYGYIDEEPATEDGI